MIPHYLQTVHDAIQALSVRKAQLSIVIERLEQLQDNPPKRGRGRKGMGQAEREEVSRRMKRYWASRRKTAA